MDPDCLKQFRLDHRAVMHAIALHLTPLPSVLKGGSALIFCYGQNRYSEDLDYNANKPLNLETRVRDAIHGINGKVLAVATDKDTDTVRRYYITYQYKSITQHVLKIETSFLEKINESDLSLTNKIRTFNIDVLAQQKLFAMRTDAGGRTKPRDLEDIRFIVQRYDHDLRPTTRARITDFAVNNGSQLINRYLSAYEADPEFKTDDLQETIEALMAYRKQTPMTS